MAEFIDDKKAYKILLRDIHIEKMRENKKECITIFYENKKKEDSNKIKALLGCFNKTDLNQNFHIYKR